MQKKKYVLHSICVHDGNANSGHYFAFIFDRFNKKWWRYNDIKITEIEDEEVMKQAEGGHSWLTAQWLVYVEESISSILDNNNITYYKVPENPYKL